MVSDASRAVGIVQPTLEPASSPPTRRIRQIERPGRLVSGSLLPQALIQCRQRPTYGLRLRKLVIL